MLKVEGEGEGEGESESEGEAEVEVEAEGLKSKVSIHNTHICEPLRNRLRTSARKKSKVEVSRFTSHVSR